MHGSDLMGTSWSFSAALAHAERVDLLDHARALHRAIGGQDVPLPSELELPPESQRTARRFARNGLLLALRDGYVRATGRLSTTPVVFPASACEGRWRLHATDPSLITTTEWREGTLDFSRKALTGHSREYIDIEMPDFMVKAIWPEPEPAPALVGTTGAELYTTPYLDLMQAAILRFGITAERQEKKESLVAWFRAQHVEGVQVSKNLAESMATLVRLPAAQRGGSKRVSGPDLRKAGR